MKRTDFIKSIFAITGISFTCKNKNDGKVNIVPERQTININGCVQYLDDNPIFYIGDDVIKVNGSDLSILISRRSNRNDSKFI